MLHNGLGRYEKALVQARQAAEQAPELFTAMWALPELDEAASRTGQSRLASDALRALVEAISIGQTDWGQGICARSRALVSEGEDAERWYREAVDRLGRTGFRSEVARAQLLFGEWLRREGRRADARAQLGAAYAMFAGIGMRAFAERTRRELMATGTVGDPSAAPRSEAVRRLGADGGARVLAVPAEVAAHRPSGAMSRTTYCRPGRRRRGSASASLTSSRSGSARTSRAIDRCHRLGLRVSAAAAYRGGHPSLW